MITESIYKRYVPEVLQSDEENENSIYFIYNTNKLLIKVSDSNEVSIPLLQDIKLINAGISEKQYIGKLEGQQCYCAELQDTSIIPEGMEFSELRPLFGKLEDGVFLLAGRAFQIVNWNRNSKFCGRCGTATEMKKDERAKVCPKCGFFSYSNVVPAIIVAVTKGDKILLAHAKHFQEGLYSVIAGFVETGETFEECVKREVMEEIGIKVKNVKYFGSQPWPFPNSIMVAFTAEYDEGEIQVDGVEIAHAAWFSKDNLPTLPMSYSVARSLINNFLESDNVLQKG